MTRYDEYRALLAGLDAAGQAAAPRLDTAIQRAAARRQACRPTRPVHFARSAAGLAGALCCFVLLVNFCAPVAHACARVPFLKELAAAVTFSPSLRRAVEEEYLQPLGLTQTQDGVTATLEYLIVDQKQVNLFFRLDSDRYSAMEPAPSLRTADGSELNGYAAFFSGPGCGELGALRCLTLDFVDADVPAGLLLTLKLRCSETDDLTAAPVSISDAPEAGAEPEYQMEFTFLLEFDPLFTAPGRVIPVNRTLTLDGQRITVESVELYPTHLRLNVAGAPENTAWLKGLDFTIADGAGNLFEPVANGISATGSGDSPGMASFRAESPWFYGADRLTLTVTGAAWLDKADARCRVDLAAGKADGCLPEGVAFAGAQRTDGGWEVRFAADAAACGTYRQLFASEYYDEDGVPYSIAHQAYNTRAAGTTCETTLYLDGFSGDTAYLCPQYSRVWAAETPVELTLRLS